MSKRDHQGSGPKGQSFVVAPRLPAYDRPSASAVTIVRRVGTQETRAALAPRLSRGSYDLARVKPQPDRCAYCDSPITELQGRKRLGMRWVHEQGQCNPAKIQPPPVQRRPTSVGLAARHLPEESAFRAPLHVPARFLHRSRQTTPGK